MTENRIRNNGIVALLAISCCNIPCMLKAAVTMEDHTQVYNRLVDIKNASESKDLNAYTSCFSQTAFQQLNVPLIISAWSKFMFKIDFLNFPDALFVGDVAGKAHWKYRLFVLSDDGKETIDTIDFETAVYFVKENARWLINKVEFLKVKRLPIK